MNKIRDSIVFHIISRMFVGLLAIAAVVLTCAYVKVALAIFAIIAMLIIAYGIGVCILD